MLRIMNGEDNVQTTERGNIHHSVTHYGFVVTQDQLEKFAKKENLSNEPVDLVDTGLNRADSFMPGVTEDAMVVYVRAVNM